MNPEVERQAIVDRYLDYVFVAGEHGLSIIKLSAYQLETLSVVDLRREIAKLRALVYAKVGPNG